MRSSKTRQSLVPMGICCIFAVLLLLSDACYYLGITSSNLLSGIFKTVLYAGICICALWMFCENRTNVNSVVVIFLIFTGITLVSTAFGVTTDIAVWRQLIHLTFFAAAFVVSYLSTQRTNIFLTKKYLLIPLWLFVVLFCIAFLTKGVGEQNVVYYLIIFLPTLSLIHSTVLRTGISVFMMFAVLISNKRTLFVAVVAYFLTHWLFSDKKQSEAQFIAKMILYTVGCLSLYFLFPRIVQALNLTVFDELKISHVLEDGGSNRFYIYEKLWTKQTSSSFGHWLVGDGYNSVLFSKICKDGFLGEWVSAHNDYLEVLYDYGMIGLIAYLAFLVSLLHKGIQMIRSKREYGAAFFSSVVMTLIISISSHLIIYLNYYVVFFVFWGMCLADHEKTDKNLYEVRECSQLKSL